MPVDPDEYVDSFKPDLMPIVSAWCQGAKFADILKFSEEQKVFEVSEEDVLGV